MLSKISNNCKLWLNGEGIWMILRVNIYTKR